MIFLLILGNGKYVTEEKSRIDMNDASIPINIIYSINE
jgi:hypothetical protein